MSAITTHVLDTVRGLPASGVPVVLEQADLGGGWRSMGRGETDADGRLRTLVPAGAQPQPGAYRLVFDVRRYFDSLGVPAFYPQVTIVFQIGPGEAHCHVPLLLAPFGYTTYRGS